MKLWRRYELEAAHQLTAGVPEGHQCRRLHGHRYLVQICVEGAIGPASGMVIEYADLDTQVWPVLRRCDHYSLNTLNERCSTPLADAVSKNPTVELLCAWLWDALAFLRQPGHTLQLVAVRIEEDSRSVAEMP